MIRPSNRADSKASGATSRSKKVPLNRKKWSKMLTYLFNEYVCPRASIWFRWSYEVILISVDPSKISSLKSAGNVGCFRNEPNGLICRSDESFHLSFEGRSCDIISSVFHRTFLKTLHKSTPPVSSNLSGCCQLKQNLRCFRRPYWQADWCWASICSLQIRILWYHFWAGQRCPCEELSCQFNGRSPPKVNSGRFMSFSLT